jgi:hypothetical protein
LRKDLRGNEHAHAITRKENAMTTAVIISIVLAIFAIEIVVGILIGR